MNVRALFRVTSVEEKPEGLQVAHLAPTYNTKNGEICEENKVFSKWTPSGTAKIVITPSGTFHGYFVAGDYYYLDVLDEPIIESVAGYVGLVDPAMTEFRVVAFEKSVGSILVKLTAPSTIGEKQADGAWLHRHGQINAKVLGDGRGYAEIAMTITNLVCLPAFDFDPGAEARKKYVVFSRCP